MGSYTTAAKVRTIIPLVTTSVLSDASVNELIGDHEAELDVALSFHGYTVPATAPDALVSWLGKLATEGVAAAALKALYQDSGGPNSEASWTVWEKRYQGGLKAIRDGNVVPAVTDSTGGQGVRSWATDYASTVLSDVEETEPVFKMRMTW